MADGACGARENEGIEVLPVWCKSMYVMNMLSFSLPENGSFDPAGKVDALLLADLEQPVYCSHVKFNQGCHPKTCLITSIVSKKPNTSGKKQALTSTPASSKIAPIVDTEDASSPEPSLSRIRLIASP